MGKKTYFDGIMSLKEFRDCTAHLGNTDKNGHEYVMVVTDDGILKVATEEKLKEEGLSIIFNEHKRSSTE